MNSGNFVRRLDEKISSLIKSEATIRGLDQALEELACNSIDAKANRVTITADKSAISVEVYDDGHGVRSEDLPLVGARHVTSKLRSLHELERGVTTLGFRGEALNSLARIAVVEILTKRGDESGTFRKILQGGDSLACGMSMKHRERGTTVLVRDLFYQQPVRRQILINGWSKEVARARERVVRLALAHPHVAFTLKEVDSHRRGRITLQTRGGRNQLADVITELWGAQSSLPLLSPFSASDPATNIKVAGLLSAPTQPLKAAQYVFVNRRFVKKTPVHKLLSAASISASPDGPCMDWVPGGQPASAARSYPAFFVHITCDPSLYDILYDADKSIIEFKTWEPVLECIRSLLTGLGQDAGHHPRVGLDNSLFAPAYKAQSRPSTSHDPRGGTMIDDFFQQRRKVAAPSTTAKCAQSSDAATNTWRDACEPPGLAHGGSWRSMAPNCLPPAAKKARVLSGACPAVPRASSAGDAQMRPALTPFHAFQPCAKERGAGLAPKDFSRVFGALEPEILDLAGDALLAGPDAWSSARPLVPNSLSRVDMRHIRVITQLDNKFILALVGGGAKLAIVDQHAADERVLLESLRKQVLGLNQTAREALLQSCLLKAPFVLHLSPLEVQLLCEHKTAVEAWGWRWRTDDVVRHRGDACVAGTGGSSRVTLLAAPTLLGTPLTVDDLQTFLALMHSSCSSSVAPPGVLSILSSKACRAAIMFGDSLTSAECLNLTQQLQKTQLCFQCAHGRPTMVPLVNMAELHQLSARCHPPSGGISTHALDGLHDTGRAQQNLSRSSLARIRRLDSSRHRPTLARARARVSAGS